jgi:hypothetical protein
MNHHYSNLSLFLQNLQTSIHQQQILHPHSINNSSLGQISARSVIYKKNSRAQLARQNLLPHILSILKVKIFVLLLPTYIMPSSIPLPQ